MGRRCGRFRSDYERALPDRRQELLMEHKKSYFNSYFKNKYFEKKLNEIYAKDLKIIVPNFYEFKNLIEDGKFYIENICFQKKKNKSLHTIFFAKPEGFYAQIKFNQNDLYMKIHIEENFAFSILGKYLEYKKIYSIIENLDEIMNNLEIWKKESDIQAKKELDLFIESVKINKMKHKKLKKLVDSLNYELRYRIDSLDKCFFEIFENVQAFKPYPHYITYAYKIIEVPFSQINEHLQEIPQIIADYKNLGNKYKVVISINSWVFRKPIEKQDYQETAIVTLLKDLVTKLPEKYEAGFDYKYKTGFYYYDKYEEVYFYCKINWRQLLIFFPKGNFCEIIEQIPQIIEDYENLISKYKVKVSIQWW
jgi:hypothetical protein